MDFCSSLQNIFYLLPYGRNSEFQRFADLVGHSHIINVKSNGLGQTVDIKEVGMSIYIVNTQCSQGGCQIQNIHVVMINQIGRDGIIRHERLLLGCVIDLQISSMRRCPSEQEKLVSHLTQRLTSSRLRSFTMRSDR